MTNHLPQAYSIAVYDLNNPIATDNVEGDSQRYAYSADHRPTIFRRGQGPLFVRRVDRDTPQIRLDSREPTNSYAIQGRIYFPHEDTKRSGLFYEDNGADPKPSFDGGDAMARKSWLATGIPVIIYPGESLTFARCLKLIVEEIKSRVKEE